MDDAVLVFDVSHPGTYPLALSIWRSMKGWFGVSFREPHKEGKNFTGLEKMANVCVIVTPRCFEDEVCRNAVRDAANGKGQIIFVHHILSVVDVAVEVASLFLPQKFVEQMEEVMVEGSETAEMITRVAMDADGNPKMILAPDSPQLPPIPEEKSRKVNDAVKNRLVTYVEELYDACND
mmetsp:Transcript_123898/g.284179  ORF Transcript_123898/g.284179 Transcript_123898/m.284179 type:complete len:179 (+) Transcript_123898:68-604(+)